MFRRSRELAQERPIPTLDTNLIRPIEPPVGTDDWKRFLVKAVLLEDGTLRNVHRTIDVYGLVLNGYEGLKFGDDGAYTAVVASQLPVERWAGVTRLNEVISTAVQAINPGYFAEFVGYISPSEASILAGVEAKRENGIPLPDHVSWEGGSFSMV